MPFCVLWVFGIKSVCVSFQQLRTECSKLPVIAVPRLYLISTPGVRVTEPQLRSVELWSVGFSWRLTFWGGCGTRERPHQKIVTYMVMAGGLSLGGEHMVLHIRDVLQNHTLETYLILLTNATSTNVIKIKDKKIAVRRSSNSSDGNSETGSPEKCHRNSGIKCHMYMARTVHLLFLKKTKLNK